jgi:glycosyltransferase involved in cell wall biosynthesis
MIDRHYADVAATSDVLLANCDSMARAMGSYGRPIHVVPNGCEFPIDVPDATVPPELIGLPRPIVGYLGNLSSRLDVPLLERLASDLPAASLVLVGSAHAGTEALALDRFPNVHLVGPRPYAEAKRFAAAFDVGIIPHVDNDMTRAMNPLKAFVYAALGLPVVATRVANLDEMGELITVAHDHASFVESVRRAVGGQRPALTPDRQRILAANSWSDRLETIMRLLDDAHRDAPPRWSVAGRTFVGARR